ncbi:riboflavin synthase subunit alpha [Snodgrassella sp. ESL0324]|uniref:riboflavin synthase subunit alpha n=1 Tax=Snodgrassella sp. ESL0324 TaxID=2705033 RepID=UPI0015842CDA|nr:riboflavin synthase subunit alpha [Snodgrassella sp. ESL0324]NUF08721.1 riboflavin synthase subunit alpha [Snodgrassella sp. ESL0324]
MFTGIVCGLGTVTSIQEYEQLRTIQVRLPEGACDNLTIGASIANNGCCLTITAIKGDEVCFDVMAESLAKTNLGQLQVGDAVNIERAAHYGDEIGGHIMSGHIFTTTTINKIEDTPDNRTVWFNLPESAAPYILTKGFIGLNGCSLTIGEVTATEFNVHLIPETMNRTLFGSCQVNDRINLEVDAQTQAIVDTAQKYMQKYINKVKN